MSGSGRRGRLARQAHPPGFRARLEAIGWNPAAPFVYHSRITPICLSTKRAGVSRYSIERAGLGSTISQPARPCCPPREGEAGMDNERRSDRTSRQLIRSAAAIGILLVAPGLGLAATSASGPDSLAELTADPVALQELARAVPPSASSPVQVLLSETLLRFDAAGRPTRTEHLIYRIDAEDRDPSWAETAAEWSPWLQERPRLEAQVIGPTGQIHRLDPSTISESPVPGDVPGVYTDDRTVKAPLPALAAGSIVEELRTVRDSTTAIDAGMAIRIALAGAEQTRLRRVVVELPAGMPFHYRLEKASATRIERTADDRRQRVVFTAESPAPLEEYDFDSPADVPRFSAVVISTGSSWKLVAEHYWAMVEPRIVEDPGRASVQALAASIAGPDRAPLGRDELIERAVRRLHQEVRNSGVELGQAAIRPGYPSETLKRRYGDCKDKSVLLLALLRELRIPAQLVILNTRSGQGLIPELPGWGACNHMIVRVTGRPELWIDATDPFSRLGELPASDQGRWALPVGDHAPDLVAIPVAPASANRIVETREFILSDVDPVRVVETVEASGAPEALYREIYGQALESNLQSEMETYARTEYLARGAVTAKTSDPQNFSGPFKRIVTAQDARRGFVDLREALVSIPRLSLFAGLPDALREFEPDSLANPAYTGHRKEDFGIDMPMRLEWRYRIVPPSGYRAEPVPEALDRALGPVRYRQEFAADSAGVVTGTLAMEPMTARFSPADVLEFRQALNDLIQSPVPTVTFRHIGLGLIDEGQLGEAIRWLSEDVKRNPGGVAARMRLSQGLLRAGLGVAARREAAEAIKMAPGLADAYANQADVRNRDLLGRQQRRGFDLAGAEAAYRKAIALDPEQKSYVANLAILLEHNQYAQRYGPGARVDEAIRLYRQLSTEELDQAGVLNNLPVALLRAGRFGELEQWTAGQRTTESILQLRVLALALTRGPAAAVAEANRIISDEKARSRALEAVCGDLVRLRRYADAAALLEAASRGREDAPALLGRAGFIKGIRPYDPASYEEDDPRGVYLRFYSQIFREHPTADSLSAFVSDRLWDDWQAVSSDLAPQQILRTLGQYFRSTDLPARAWLDILANSVSIQVEGDADIGYRLRATGPTPEEPADIFIVRERGRWVLTNLAKVGVTSGIGYEAARHLKKGNVSAARRWLAWGSEFTPTTSEDSMRVRAFRAFYRGADESDQERLRLAAASLLVPAGNESGLTALDLLRGSRFSPSSTEERYCLRLLRAQAFLSGGLADSALAVVAELKQGDPSLRLFQIEMRACTQLKDMDRARRLAEERLARLPDDTAALRRLLSISGRSGDYASVTRYARRLDGMQGLWASDLNNWAWYDLVAGTVTDSTLIRINRAILEDGGGTSAQLHTKACILAEMNRTTEARDVLFQTMDLRGLTEPDDGCWYVLGRMAEQYGQIEAARDAYRRVYLTTETFGEPSTVYLLAQRRLQALPAPAKQD